MRIVIDLPDWVEERHIRIFAGIEEVAKKHKDESWKIKTVRCNMCGKCCMALPSTWKHGIDPKTGWCVNLELVGTDYRCKMNIARPFSCSAGDHDDEDYCCVRWKDAELE